jgi:Tol biopolymer transport system component
MGAYSWQVKGVVFAVALFAVTLRGAAARSDALTSSSVRTLVAVPGTIEAFAQDGNHVAWAKTAECGRNVGLRTLSSGKTTYLDGRNGPMCKLTEFAGGLQPEMALAGTRALWAYVDVSLSHYNFTLFTGAPGQGSERRLDQMSIEGGQEDEGGAFHPVPVGGHRRTLVYADINTEAGTPSGVYRVMGTSAHNIVGTRRAFTVAVSGSRFALARSVPAGCACNWNATWSPDGRQIAFVSGRGEGGTKYEGLQLFVMNADGSGLHRVMADVQQFAWAPDGSSFAIREGDDASNRLALVRSDGSGVREIAPAASFAWSPDARRVAYVSPDGHLFVVSTSGGAPVPLGDASQNDPLDWSPDSTAIAYTRFFGEVGHVYVSTANGGAASDLGVGAWAAWSPDGSAIAFLRSDDGIYVMAANGAGAHRVASVANAMPEWSPDGTWISYQTIDGLWLVRRDASGQRELVAREVGAMEWSPDSRAIAYTDAEGAQSITIVDTSSGETTLESRACAGIPDWSPDATRVTCEAPTNSGLGGEIAVLDASTGGVTPLTHTTAAPARAIVETRSASGKLLSSFDAPAGLRGIAFGGSRLALAIGSTIEIRDTRGKRFRSVKAAAPNGGELSMAGRWVVFQSRRTAWLLDAITGRTNVLAQPKTGTFITGLSIDGRRIAWAESGTRSSRIRAVFVPPRLVKPQTALQRTRSRRGSSAQRPLRRGRCFGRLSPTSRDFRRSRD